jgi:hypothetical protein
LTEYAAFTRLGLQDMGHFMSQQPRALSCLWGIRIPTKGDMVAEGESPSLKPIA